MNLCGLPINSRLTHQSPQIAFIAQFIVLVHTNLSSKSNFTVTIKLLQVLMEATLLETINFRGAVETKKDIYLCHLLYSHFCERFQLLTLSTICQCLWHLYMDLQFVLYHANRIIYIHLFTNAIWKYTWNTYLLFSYQKETLFD